VKINLVVVTMKVSITKDPYKGVQFMILLK